MSQHILGAAGNTSVVRVQRVVADGRTQVVALRIQQRAHAERLEARCQARVATGPPA